MHARDIQAVDYMAKLWASRYCSPVVGRGEDSFVAGVFNFNTDNWLCSTLTLLAAAKFPPLGIAREGVRGFCEEGVMLREKLKIV